MISEEMGQEGLQKSLPAGLGKLVNFRLSERPYLKKNKRV